MKSRNNFKHHRFYSLFRSTYFTAESLQILKGSSSEKSRAAALSSVTLKVTRFIEDATIQLDCIGCAALAILSYKYQAIAGKQWLDYASTFTLGGKKKKKKKIFQVSGRGRAKHFNKKGTDAHMLTYTKDL